MSKLFIEDTSLVAIGDAIRAKTGKSNKMTPAQMATEIGSITTGGGGGSTSGGDAITEIRAFADGKNALPIQNYAFDVSNATTFSFKYQYYCHPSYARVCTVYACLGQGLKSVNGVPYYKYQVDGSKENQEVVFASASTYEDIAVTVDVTNYTTIVLSIEINSQANASSRSLMQIHDIQIS